MTEEEQKKDPTFKPGDLDPLVPVQITLTSAKEVATGESKYGEWWLWTVSVTNMQVHDRDAKKVIKNYTGDATLFPSDKLQEKLLKATNGTQENVKIELTMVPKKNSRGKLYTTYDVKVLEAGTSPANSVLSAYSKFIEDFKNFVKIGMVKGTPEDFKGLAISDTYGIPEDKVEQLYKLYKEK